MQQDKVTKSTLIGGAVAAVAASACCLGPLILVSLGISGAWISNLTLLEPFRPIFVAVALVCIGLAYRRIYHPAPAEHCTPGTACSLPQANMGYRLLFWGISALVIVALAYPYLVTLLY